MVSGKISIRFFNDREVRAAWDDASGRWLFAASDIVGVLTESSNPRKYWSVIKNRLKKEYPQLTTNCSQLKMTASDGKRYLTDCFSQDEILQIVESIPSRSKVAFVKWLTYSEDTIDGKSRAKAYALFESGILATLEPGTARCLQQIHAFLFGGLYEFAGKIRSKNISKGGFTFANALHLPATLETIENMPATTFDEITDKYIEMNVAHPFMEGNGRATRIWLDMMLTRSLLKCIDWSKVDKKKYLKAMEKSVADGSDLKKLLKSALTDKINDREMFMKGVDYSYYYESDSEALVPEDEVAG